jgi:hypothetical protein
MPSLLDPLPASIFAGFKGKLLTGEVRRYAGSDTLDAHGDPTAAAPDVWTVEGFEDEFSDFSRAQAGIPATDFKVCIFAASSVPAGFVPQEGDLVNLGRGWASLRKAATDPAIVLWTCQAFRTRAPE